MLTRLSGSNASRLTWILLPAIFLCAFQIARSDLRKKICVVAVRDSRLLTMCPDAGEVKLPGGKTWKSDNNAMVTSAWRDQFISFPQPNGAMIDLSLPLPAQVPQDQTPRLDRIAPDATIQDGADKAFARQKEYALVDSADKADLVFLVEGTYISWAFWGGARRGGINFNNLDLEDNFLQACLAIVVPAGIYRSHPGDGAALMEARLWEGSVAYQDERSADGVPKPASVADLVGQFLNEKKRPRSHFPLCAASDHPLQTAGTGPQTPQTERSLKTAGADTPATAAQGKLMPADSKTIKVDVALVTVPVIATDSAGKYVPDLKESDFHIFEDDREQKLDRLIATAQPFNVALMLDMSASMVFNGRELQNAALRFVGALRTGDRLMVVSFNDLISLYSELSDDPGQLRPAMLQIGVGHGTRLYDAIYLIITDRLNALPERKSIILFTDGADTRSRLADAASTLALLQESQVLVYVIQYDTRQDQKITVTSDVELKPKLLPRDTLDTRPMYARAARFLQEVSETSGGRLYHAATMKNLDDAFIQIAEELSLQYTLCYYPRNQSRDGTYRRIRVEVERPGVKIRARPGYRAGTQPATEK
ncbi:MAG: VWA domain-containing protein [Acidobacteriota bacterium]